jgi:hypothetical protein
MVTIDTWVIQSTDLRAANKLLLEEYTNHMSSGNDDKPKPSYIYPFQRLHAPAMTNSPREEWFDGFHDCYYIGDHSLRVVLPLVVRAIADGIRPHMELKMALHQRHDQAKSLDKIYHAYLTADQSWSLTLTRIVGGINDDPRVYKPNSHDEFTREVAQAHWLFGPQFWEMNDYRSAIDDHMKKMKEAMTWKLTSNGIEVNEEYAVVSSSLTILDGLPVWLDRNNPEVDLKMRANETKEKTKVQHDKFITGRGLHEQYDFKISAKDVWNDTHLAFLVGGGYTRYSRIQNKAGGQYGYTAKFCSPNFDVVKNMKQLPNYIIPFHRETWHTMSLNLFVGWHTETINKLAEVWPPKDA